MALINTQIFQKLEELTGYANADLIISQLTQNATNYDSLSGIAASLASISIPLSTKVGYDKEGHIQELGLSLKASSARLNIPGWKGISFDIPTCQLQLGPKSHSGSLTMNLVFGDLALQAEGKVVSTADGLGWLLDLQTNAHFLKLFSGNQSISESLIGLCEVLNIDQKAAFKTQLFIAHGRIELRFQLPVKPLSLLGSLQLQRPVLRLGISSFLNDEENSVAIALDGELSSNSQILANTSIGITKYPKSFRFDLDIEAIEKLGVRHLSGNQSSFELALKPLPTRLQDSILNKSWLKSLHGSLHLAKSEQTFSIETSGTFLDFPAETTFSLQHSGKRAFLFLELALDDKAALKSVNQLLTENFGLIEQPVEGPLGHVLDQLKLQTDLLRFDQAEGSLAAQGRIKLGEMATYRASTGFSWGNKAFNCQFSLARIENGEVLNLKSFLGALHPGLADIGIPGCEKLLDSILSTGLERLAMELDSSSKIISIETSLQLFSKIEALLTFHADIAQKTISFSISCNDPLSLRELLEACGLDAPDDLPHMELHLKSLEFNSRGLLKAQCSSTLETAQIGKLELKKLELELDVPERTFNLHTETAFSLAEGLLQSPLQSEAQLTLEKQKSLSFRLKGSFKLSDMPFDYELDLAAEKKTFEASTRDVSLKKILNTFSESSLPVGVPDPTLEELTFSYEHQQSLKISAIITNQDALSIAGSDLQMNSLKFEFESQKQKSIPNISITTGFSINLMDTVKVDNGSFSFELKDQEGKPSWTLSNEMPMEFFGHSLALKSYYTHSSEQQAIGFEVSNFPEISFIDDISFRTEQVGLKLEKGKGEALSLVLNSASHFHSPVTKDISGSFEFRKKDSQLALKFSSTASVDLAIAELPELPRCKIHSPELSVTYNTDNKQWSSKGSTQLQFSNIPEVVTALFPEDAFEASFNLGSQENYLELKIKGENGGPWKLKGIPLPPKPHGNDGHQVLDLGILYIGANDFRIDFKQSELSANVYLGLPEKLNEVFKKEDGSPMNLFRTSKTGEPEGAIRFKLGMGAKDLSIQMLDSPFRAFPMNEGKLIIDMKVSDEVDFGAFSLLAPKFKFDSGNLVASGGIKVEKRLGVKEGEPDRELGIPTTMVKWFLKQIGLETLAKKLTPKVAFRGINYAPLKNGHRTFNSTALLDLFIQDKHSLDIPAWLRKPIELIDEAGGKLPDAFLEYGDLELMDYFSFSIEFSAPSNLKFDISFKEPGKEDDAKPLKLLIPQFPQLMGIKLYSIGFGELWNGTLFHVDLDCGFDSFDLPGIFAALAIDELWKDSQNYLPSPKDLHQSFRIKNLTTLIIYQTEIPIPIPLFYDELSISALDMKGFGSQAYLSFPKPRFGLAQLKALSALTTELIRFFKNPTNYKIRWDRMSDGDLTTLTVGPGYVQYPKYLAKERKPGTDEYDILKISHSRFEIGAIKILTALMSAIQNGSINELIQTRELEERYGSKFIKIFEILDVELKYAFTTPGEFIGEAWNKLNLFDETKPNQFLDMLPPKRQEVKKTEDSEDITLPIKADTEGMVTFFDGKIRLGDHFDSHTSLGMIITNVGAGLGGQFDLNIGQNIINGLMQGHVAISKEGFELAGKSYFRMLGIEFFSGSFLLRNGEIQLRTRAGVDPNPIFYIDAGLDGHINNQEFYLKGNGQLNLFGFEATGNILYHFSASERTFKLDQSHKLFGDFIQMDTSMAYAGGHGSEAFAANLNFNIGDLIRLNASGAVVGSANFVGMKGKVNLSLLGVETEVQGELIFQPGIFNYFSKIKLLGGMIQGDVSGHISDSDFLLGGKGVDFGVGDTRFSSTALTIKKESDQLVLTLTGNILDSHFTLNSTLSSEQLVLQGTVDPIRWLSVGGSNYLITIHDGNGGPMTFRVGLASDGQKEVYFKGRVSLLGISETDVTILVLNDYWHTRIEHSFSLGSFLSSRFSIDLKMKEGYWVTGAGKLETGIRIFVPAVKFSFNVYIPFFGKKRVTLTLVPEINLGQLIIRHNLQFKIYMDEEMMRRSQELKEAIANLELRAGKAKAKLEASEQILKAIKDRGGFEGHKQGILQAYNGYKERSGLEEKLRKLDDHAASIERTITQILEECFDNQLNRHYEYIDRTLNSMMLMLEEVGFNEFEDSRYYDKLKDRLLKSFEERIKRDKPRVVLQNGNYNMSRPGGDHNRVDAEMRTQHAGDEFELEIQRKYCRLHQGSFRLSCHNDYGLYKGHKQAVFTKEEVIAESYVENGRPVVRFENGHLFDRHLNLDITYDNGLKICSQNTKDILSYRGSKEDVEPMQWRSSGPDRYQCYVQIRSKDVPTGYYKIKSGYKHYIVRPGGNKDEYKVDFRHHSTGDALELQRDGDKFSIRQGDYFMCMPGGSATVRKADFRKRSSPLDYFKFIYDQDAKGHYITYEDHYLYTNTDRGYLEFRSDGHKTAYQLFRIVENGDVFSIFDRIYTRLYQHFDWIRRKVNEKSDNGKKSFGFFAAPEVDDYMKSESKLAQIHFLEDKVIEDKHEVLKLTEKISELKGHLQKIEEQMKSSDIHFWMEFSTEFEYAGHSFKLGDIRVNFNVAKYTNINQCLSKIPEIVAQNLKDNALSIFTGKKLPEDRQQYAGAISHAGEPGPDMSKLKNEYNTGIDKPSDVMHDLDEFL